MGSWQDKYNVKPLGTRAAPLYQPVGPLGSRPAPAARPVYQPSGYTPFGPTSGAAQYNNMPASRARPAAATTPRQPGALSGPGHYERWYEENKGLLGAPTQGQGVLGEAAGYFRQPNRTAGYADRALAPGGYFQTPGYQEGYAARNLPGLEGTKSYAEQLYESGNQGLNTFYDRERDKRQKRLEDQMSAMGVFGSGATARGMFELEAELGAQQARDMAGLAGQADTSRLARHGEARATASAGDQGALDRYSTGAEIGNLADASVDRQGRGLADVGTQLDTAEGRRLERAGRAAESAQSFFENRETGGFDRMRSLAGDKAGLLTRFSEASADEQAAIKRDMIQSLIAEYGIDADAAEQMFEEMLMGAGNLVNARGGTGGAPARQRNILDPMRSTG